jgi:hypothetical protein
VCQMAWPACCVVAAGRFGVVFTHRQAGKYVCVVLLGRSERLLAPFLPCLLASTDERARGCFLLLSGASRVFRSEALRPELYALYT